MHARDTLINYYIYERGNTSMGHIYIYINQSFKIILNYHKHLEFEFKLEEFIFR